MSQDSAQAAIFDAVEKIAKAAGATPNYRTAGMLRDVAIAYRAASGGPQVDAVFVEKE